MTCLSTHDELIIDVGKKQQKETTNVITWQGYGITGQLFKSTHLLLSNGTDCVCMGLTVCVCMCMCAYTHRQTTHTSTVRREGGEERGQEERRRAEREREERGR
jgi:hypothetical protein